MIAQIIFTLMLIVSFGMFAKQVGRLRRNIMLGRPEKITGNTAQRFKNMVLVAFGQQKMFKRLLPAFLHLSIYVAFIITQIELIEVFIDGFTGQHRLIWHTVEGTALAGLYTFTISFIEILSVLALIATFIFLARRNLLKIPRFHKPEMNGWPKLDGNLILYFEIYLVTCIFMMNSGDQALQALDVYHHTDAFTVSSLFVPMLSGLSEGTIWAIERIGWWGHLIGVLIFLNYIPYSKHLHIFLAFPNTFFARLTPKGELTNMEAVKKEVAPMFEIEEEVIAAPVMKVAESKDAFANPSETVDDIFGDPNEEEGISDIFGDAGSEQEEGISDIFGDAGSEQEEGISDIFGDAGSEQEEGISDIFGDAGSEQEEGISDIFGDVGSEQEEGISDIFGDAGSEQEEGISDIFGDAGSEQEEGISDIFGDAGSEQEEGISDVFGNAGSEQEESVDDIFGGNSTEESVDDIFGGNSAEENVDDIFGGNDNDVSTDDIFDAPVAQPTKKAVTPVAVEPEEEIIKFGASDVFDLSWKSLMDSYTCTECGRCTSVCPANLTGKKLSPRKVMMDVRDRADEIGKNLDAKTHTVKDYDDGKNLFDYITTEELHACTTCNACVEACPVLINPLDIIVELRRNLILDQAKSPESWNVMFTNIENNGAPWQFSASDRANWIEEI
jgi:heterodisulfide reductase subunit C